MTLGTHAIVGAAVASLVPNHPLIGLTLGLGSHFLLDAIPHWDYQLRSTHKDPNNPLKNRITLNKNFVVDVFKMGFDAIFGVFVVFIWFGFFEKSILTTPLWGAVGGLIPDALQFVYLKWKHEPMISLQRFHIWIHTSKKIENSTLGAFLQIGMIILIIAVVKFLSA